MGEDSNLTLVDLRWLLRRKPRWSTTGKVDVRRWNSR